MAEVACLFRWTGAVHVSLALGTIGLPGSFCRASFVSYRPNLVAGKCSQNFAGIVSKRSVSDPRVWDSPSLAQVQHAAFREGGAKRFVYHRYELFIGE